MKRDLLNEENKYLLDWQNKNYSRTELLNNQYSMSIGQMIEFLQEKDPDVFSLDSVHKPIFHWSVSIGGGGAFSEDLAEALWESIRQVLEKK